jgi:hypothetical protein
MKTTADIADALLRAAGLASEGKADVAQAEVLCKCTDTLIKLARLQLESSGGKAGSVKWLNDGEPDADRVSALRSEQAVLMRELDKPTLSDGEEKRLTAKLVKVQAELSNDA